jgi:hypothetical protein
VTGAFFTVDGDALAPSEGARSWWVPGMVHGRLLAGLLVRALERERSAAGFRFARLTVDLFRNAPFGPVTVTTTTIREGHRIRVAEATAHAANGLVARAGAVLLRTGPQPDGAVPATPAWDAPHPADLPPSPRERSPHTWRFDGANRPVGAWPAEGGRRVWLHEVTDLVAGEPNSPLVRAGLAADAASPLAHRSGDALEFINADYTLYLSREPVGEFIGLAADGHTSSDGIAVGQCTVHDVAGPLGYCSTAAIANPGVAPDTRPGTAATRSIHNGR